MIGEYVERPDRVQAMLWDGESYDAAKELLGDKLLDTPGDKLLIDTNHWSDGVEVARVGQMVVLNVKAEKPYARVMDLDEFEREYESA
ncbi:unnamed protein product [marine sediment metagenome]|uniref:Uncharacterized protein n=1 Tax=marine sediment metagenome TaxID=412755 RepID=X0Y5K2_9ZZZZ